MDLKLFCLCVYDTSRLQSFASASIEARKITKILFVVPEAAKSGMVTVQAMYVKKKTQTEEWNPTLCTQKFLSIPNPATAQFALS